jgi:hypothetical protein
MHHYILYYTTLGNNGFATLLDTTIPDYFRVTVDGDVVTAVPKGGVFKNHYKHAGTVVYRGICVLYVINVFDLFVFLVWYEQRADCSNNLYNMCVHIQDMCVVMFYNAHLCLCDMNFVFPPIRC